MPKDINLEINSVKNIIGNCQEVTVYGLKDCRYYSVINALEKQNIKTNCWSEINFPIIKYDDINFDPNNNMATEKAKAMVSNSRKYKTIITSLVIENYKRSKENKPLIPLLFCIGLEEANKKIVLNAKKVAESRRGRDMDQPDNPANSSITEKELRRCYKMCTETSPELRKIAKETFKFVKLKQDPSHPRLFTLEQVKPFFEEDFWDQAWQERRKHRLPVQFPKHYSWRLMLPPEISNHRLMFFSTPKYSHFSTPLEKGISDDVAACPRPSKK